MKKVFALGLLVAASFVLLGCQQPPQEVVTGEPGEQTASTTATVTISEGEVSTSTGTLEILPAPEVPVETATGTVEILPSNDGLDPSGMPIDLPTPEMLEPPML